MSKFADGHISRDRRIGEPGLGIDAVELGGFDQCVGDRGCLATTIGAGEQPIFPAHRDTAHGPFGTVIIGHAVLGASISGPVFPSVMVSGGSGTGASECEEAGRPI